MRRERVKHSQEDLLSWSVHSMGCAPRDSKSSTTAAREQVAGCRAAETESSPHPPPGGREAIGRRAAGAVASSSSPSRRWATWLANPPHATCSQRQRLCRDGCTRRDRARAAGPQTDMAETHSTRKWSGTREYDAPAPTLMTLEGGCVQRGFEGVLRGSKTRDWEESERRCGPQAEQGRSGRGRRGGGACDGEPEEHRRPVQVRKLSPQLAGRPARALTQGQVTEAGSQRLDHRGWVTEAGSQRLDHRGRQPLEAAALEAAAQWC